MGLLGVIREPAIVPHASFDWHICQLEKNEVVHQIVLSMEHNYYLAKECGTARTFAVQTVHPCTPFHTTNGHT